MPHQDIVILCWRTGLQPVDAGQTRAKKAFPAPAGAALFPKSNVPGDHLALV
jgi:hypothetical protein